MKRNPPDTPQVQVELDSPLGGKHQQQVNVQSNRTDPVERFRWQWLNVFYIPSDLSDLLIDAVTYTLTAALGVSILIQVWSVMNPLLFGVFLWLLFSALFTLTLFVCREVRAGWILIAYRAALVASGIVIGGVL